MWDHSSKRFDWNDSSSLTEQSVPVHSQKTMLLIGRIMGDQQSQPDASWLANSCLTQINWEQNITLISHLAHQEIVWDIFLCPNKSVGTTWNNTGARTPQNNYVTYVVELSVVHKSTMSLQLLLLYYSYSPGQFLRTHTACCVLTPGNKHSSQQSPSFFCYCVKTHNEIQLTASNHTKDHSHQNMFTQFQPSISNIQKRNTSVENVQLVKDTAFV